jgi:hypothetical protein
MYGIFLAGVTSALKFLVPNTWRFLAGDGFSIEVCNSYLGIPGWGSFSVEGFDSCLVIPGWGGFDSVAETPSRNIPAWGIFLAGVPQILVGELQYHAKISPQL